MNRTGKITGSSLRGVLWWRRDAVVGMLPLTAMLDVLFLLVFFLVLGSRFDSVEAVHLAVGRGEGLGQQQETKVRLRADGGLWVGDKRLVAGEELEELRSLETERILLLPQADTSVGDLLYWHGVLSEEWEGLRVGVKGDDAARR